VFLPFIEIGCNKNWTNTSNPDFTRVLLVSPIITHSYSVELGVKVARGLTENALKIRYNGGIIPYGLIMDEEQQYKTDPLTAPVVREIFERYAAGDSVADIRESLSARGIKTKTDGDQLNFKSI
jgi:hypothetical protein